uniref:Protein draper-like n=1 Tax=Crassostrea virginica TaxID=6565 RepID=A0A8B8AUL8_CRAVI|nr:protein draper-like [Crassostrea virginica]
MAVLCMAFICILSVQFVIFYLGAAVFACKPGYHGRYCTDFCRYPNYGPLCQEGCNCSKDYCHHITGCLNSDVTHNTTEGQSIIKETSKLVPELSTLMNDHVDVARTSAAKIQSAIKRTQLVSEQSTVNNACPVGYFSPNCSLPCRYPNYGAGCQLKCVCETKNCSHITGCQNSRMAKIQRTNMKRERSGHKKYL